MKAESVVTQLELQTTHFRWQKFQLPVVDAGIYNTLGRRLFDLYKKYEVSAPDQREIEALIFTLQSHNLSRSGDQREV